MLLGTAQFFIFVLCGFVNIVFCYERFSQGLVIRRRVNTSVTNSQCNTIIMIYIISTAYY